MNTLFAIETDKVSLSFSRVRGAGKSGLENNQNIPGRLEIQRKRSDLVWKSIKREDVPVELNDDPDCTIGPRVYEETAYKIYLHATNADKIEILHQDPVLMNDLDREEAGKTIYGTINFRSQVGFSEFTVMVDGEAEFTFMVEVFPTKLDYRSDYEKILAEVQEILTGLAMEYLRSTYQLGVDYKPEKSSQLEWIILLKNIVNQLERSLQYIAKYPIRGLIREINPTRVEKIKHLDSAVRKSVRCGLGKGQFLSLNNGLSVRRQINENNPRPTLDTMEHRWLAGQLRLIAERLSLIYREELALWRQNVQNQTQRRQYNLEEIRGLESRVAGLRKLEPLVKAKGYVPMGFASMQLLGSPGYREAYKACLILSLGLRIEGGPLQLSVKDISELYEYWCYLALVRIMSEETNQDIPTEKLFAIQERGLQVLLKKGRKHTIPFINKANKEISITYNPKFDGKELLIPQKPDILITLKDENWPKINLVFDAKYRVDASDKYKERYGLAGPPEDALNIMHRYRDAILEFEKSADKPNLPKRTVIQAAALYPCSYEASMDYTNSRLWEALQKIGIGAIPFLPDNIDYMRKWMYKVLKQGGFTLSDQAISYKMQEKAHEYSAAAAQTVLVGLLRPANALQHLEWIKEKQCYYMPLLKTQLRQYYTKYVAVYSPLILRNPGAVTHFAEVKNIEIIKRSEINTPWSTARGKDELQIVYNLGEVKDLPAAIENFKENQRSQGMRTHRWTTLLAVQRAYHIEELLLETEPEWRLFEDLKAADISFTLAPDRVEVIDPDNPRGRAWFIFNDGLQVRYAGASGFAVKRSNAPEKFFINYEKLKNIIFTKVSQDSFLTERR